MPPVADRTTRDVKREIEIDEDLEFQRRYWKIQRIGWAVLALVLVLAALGVFGEGLLSRTTAREVGFTVEYSRFAREDAPMLIVVRVPASAVRAGEVRLSFNADYISKLSLQRITPRPERIEASADEVTFHFLANPGQGDLTFSIEAKPRNPGRNSVRMAVDGASSVSFWQLVYP